MRVQKIICFYCVDTTLYPAHQNKFQLSMYVYYRFVMLWWQLLSWVYSFKQLNCHDRIIIRKLEQLFSITGTTTHIGMIIRGSYVVIQITFYVLRMRIVFLFPPPCMQLTANTCIQTTNSHTNARPSCNQHILGVAGCCMCVERRWRYVIVHYHWAINVVPERLFYEPGDGGATVAPQTTLNYAGLCFVRDATPLHTS